MAAATIRWAALPSTLLRDASARGLSAFVRLVLVDVVAGGQVTALPGLTVYSPGLAAEELQATTRGVEKALAELAAAGLILHDRARRVVWSVASAEASSNGLRNPAQVSGWNRYWTTIPSCQPKDTAREWLFRMLQEKGPQFSEAFAKFARPGVVTVPETVPVTVPETVQGTALTSPDLTETLPHLDPSPDPTSTRPPGQLTTVRKLVQHLGDPLLAGKLNAVWACQPDLDIAVEMFLGRVPAWVNDPSAWLVAQARKLHDDPDALKAFRERADEIRAERVRAAERETERQRREAEREEREREAERQAAERRAALEAEWAELYARNALPAEPPQAFVWRVQDAQHPHDPRGFLVLQYQSVTGRTMREAHADAAARGFSTELPASHPGRRAASATSKVPERATTVKGGSGADETTHPAGLTGS